MLMVLNGESGSSAGKLEMKIYIDQSGKIESTEKNTALAFSNDERCAILIPAKVKRQLQEMFRRGGRPRLFVYRTFAASVFILIKPFLKKLDTVIIDLEYPGHEAMIKDMVLEYIRLVFDVEEIPCVFFERVGKASKAHDLAWKVFKKKIEPKKVIGLRELTSLAIKKDRALRKSEPRAI